MITVFEKQRANNLKGTRVCEKQGATCWKGTGVFKRQGANRLERDQSRVLEKQGVYLSTALGRLKNKQQSALKGTRALEKTVSKKPVVGNEAPAWCTGGLLRVTDLHDRSIDYL